MQTRDLLILCLVLLFGATGLVLWSVDGSPAIQPDPTVEGPEPPVAPVNPPVGEQPNAEGGGVLETGSELVGGTREGADTAGWTSGIVRGDITLAVSVLDRLGPITVIVEELRSPSMRGGSSTGPHSQAVPVERGKGTPIFEVRDIPFSKYPYSVSVYAPGLSGSRCTVVVDEENPLHENLELTIAPGTPFSVRVRDQDMNPYADVEVRLTPVGKPLGRRQHLGRADALGTVVLEDVIAGPYELSCSQQGQPLIQPRTVSVEAGGRVQGQGFVLEVPRGTPLEVLVSNKVGYGIDRAKVVLEKLDTLRSTQLEGWTDSIGRFIFQHITPGRWMLRVTKEGHSTHTRPITIVDGVPPARQEIKLTPRF